MGSAWVQWIGQSTWPPHASRTATTGIGGAMASASPLTGKLQVNGPMCRTHSHPPARFTHPHTLTPPLSAPAVCLWQAKCARETSGLAVTPQMGVRFSTKRAW